MNVQQSLGFSKNVNVKNFARQIKEFLLVGLIGREAAVASRIKVLQVQAASALNLGRNGRVDNRVTALLHRLHQKIRNLVKGFDPTNMSVQISLDHSGVDAVHLDVAVILTLEHVVQVEGHQDLGSL